MKVRKEIQQTASSSIAVWSGGSDPIYILVFYLKGFFFLVAHELPVALCISELGLNRRGLQ